MWGGLWAGGVAICVVDHRASPVSAHGKMFVMTAMNPAGEEVTKFITCGAAPFV